MHNVSSIFLIIKNLHTHFHTVGSRDIFAMSLIIHFCLLTSCCFLFHSTSMFDSVFSRTDFSLLAFLRNCNFLSTNRHVNGLFQDSSNTNIYGSLQFSHHFLFLSSALPRSDTFCAVFWQPESGLDLAQQKIQLQMGVKRHPFCLFFFQSERNIFDLLVEQVI